MLSFVGMWGPQEVEPDISDHGSLYSLVDVPPPAMEETKRLVQAAKAMLAIRSKKNKEGKEI